MAVAVAVAVAAREEISRALDEATKGVGLLPDVPALLAVKRLARSSEGNLRTVFSLLRDKLRANHAQVRYLALQVVDELFMRSKLFRQLLVDMFEPFLQLTVGHRTEFPLPPPKERASALREKAIECAEKWNDAFGLHYRALHLGYRYLKDTLRYKFPNLPEQRAAEERQRREKEERIQKMLAAKFERFQETFPEMKGEAEATLDQIEQAFQIIKRVGSSEPASAVGGNDFLDEAFQKREDSDDENEEALFGTREMRRTAVELDAENERRKANMENVAVVESLHELLKLLSKRHLVATQEWLTLLSRVELDDRRLLEQLLKDVIDLRNRLTDARKRCEEHGIKVLSTFGEGLAISREDDMEGVEWETGASVSQDIAGAGHDVMDVKRGEAVAAVAEEGCSKDATRKPSCGNAISRESSLQLNTAIKNERVTKEVSKEKMTLFQSAPVVPWGHYLDHWGEEDRIQVDTRGLTVDNHWGPINSEAVLPADRVKELSLRTSYYEPEAVPNRPCRAPLKSGGLCQRRDAAKCPLHGVIINRDARGQPVTDESRQEGAKDSQEPARGADIAERGMETTAEATCDDADAEPAPDASRSALDRLQHSEMLRGLAKQAVENVRMKDNSAGRERKRLEAAGRSGARLASEHNEAVLRQAALAGSRQGLGEVLGEDLEESMKQEVSRTKRRKGDGLAAMLKKKETTRDRLSKRLLNTRVRGATAKHIAREDERSQHQVFSASQ